MPEKPKAKTEHSPELRDLIRAAYQNMTSAPDECIRLGEEALALANKEKNPVGKAHALMHIGLGLFHKGELASALEYYKQAESIFVSENDLYGQRSVFNNIGIIYNNWNERDQALAYYEKSLALEEQMPEPKFKCKLLNNIGNIHDWARDYDLALDYYRKALALAREIGFTYSERVVLSSIGKELVRTGNITEGLVYMQEAIAAFASINNINGSIITLQQMAETYLKTGENAKALALFEEAMQKAEQIKNKGLISQIAYGLADFYAMTNDEVQQQRYLELCLSYSIPENYRSFAVNALRELAQLQERQGRFEEALKSYWQYQEIKNFLIDENKNQIIHRLRVQMEVSEKDREVIRTRQTNAELEKKNKLILRQKTKLEKAEKKLREWNHSLEERVAEEIEKRRQQEQFLIQKSKLESLGRLAAGIAHEINQPLGMINLGIQNLINKARLGKLTTDYINGKASYFEENIERIRKTIEHIRIFSREQQNTKLERFALCETIRSAISLINIQFRNSEIRLETELPEYPISALGNRHRFEQVILNLISNARDAVLEKFGSLDASGYIRVRARQLATNILLEVSDNGCGISSQNMERLFEPFFTTKAEQSGTGLGLSICYGIIREMDGEISCQSNPGQGTCFSITLPVYE